MLDSKVVDRLRLARGALLLVSEGKSERSAVSRIASTDPQLRHEKSSALALVIDTVSTLDLLDKTIQTAFPGSEFDKRSIALFRLAAHMIFADNISPKADVIRALRKISSGPEGPRLENLLGHLVASGPSYPQSAMVGLVLLLPFRQGNGSQDSFLSRASSICSGQSAAKWWTH